jgi:hypothetical protein
MRDRTRAENFQGKLATVPSNRNKGNEYASLLEQNDTA